MGRLYISLDNSLECGVPLPFPPLEVVRYNAAKSRDLASRTRFGVIDVCITPNLLLLEYSLKAGISDGRLTFCCRHSTQALTRPNISDIMQDSAKADLFSGTDLPVNSDW